ncbi:DNA polymerase III subunit delta' [bacterium]|nr:DNA polymerase III subunit delta' [bacterium]
MAQTTEAGSTAVVEIIDSTDDPGTGGEGDQPANEASESTGTAGGLAVRFPDVIGQERITTALGRSLRNGRVPHAMLFLGDDGVGKEATALDFARALLCRGKAGEKPCEQCADCAKTRQLQHPNLKILFPLPTPKESSDDDAAGEEYTAAQQRKIDEVLAAKRNDYYAPLEVQGGREIVLEHIRTLRREFAKTSYSGEYRVVLISAADRLRVQAANAFLKLLEEPPGGAVFILTSSRESRLLATIISRCQTFRFSPLPTQLLERALIERRNVATDAAATAARLAGGSWMQAREWAEGDPGRKMEQVVGVFRVLYKYDPGKIDELVDQLSTGAAAKELPVLLELMSIWLRDVQRFDADPERYAHLGRDASLSRFAQVCAGRDFARAVEEIEQARLDIERYVQPGLVMHQLLVRIATLLFDHGPLVVSR